MLDLIPARPWKTLDQYIEDANDQTVPVASGYHDYVFFEGERFHKVGLAVAEHIVKCVNMHDDLMALLREVVDHVQANPAALPQGLSGKVLLAAHGVTFPAKAPEA